MTTPETPERARFFGRSKGKTLRKTQSAIWSEGLARLGFAVGDATLDPASRSAWRSASVAVSISSIARLKIRTLASSVWSLSSTAWPSC
jgi:hypothetical protein